MTAQLILASSSVSRRTMLESAGVLVSVAIPSIDEDVLKGLLSDSGNDVFNIAGELAEAKARSVSRHARDTLVLSADQILVCEGRIFNKAQTEEEARETLRALSGREHQLISAAVFVRDGVVQWRRSDVATLQMRRLSDAFIHSYLSAEMPDVLGSVGCYRIEGRGAQLFTDVSGDHFSIRGLPLIPLLAALRDFGVLPG